MKINLLEYLKDRKIYGRVKAENIIAELKADKILVNAIVEGKDRTLEYSVEQAFDTKTEITYEDLVEYTLSKKAEKLWKDKTYEAKVKSYETEDRDKIERYKNKKLWAEQESDLLKQEAVQRKITVKKLSKLILDKETKRADKENKILAELEAARYAVNQMLIKKDLDKLELFLDKLELSESWDVAKLLKLKK